MFEMWSSYHPPVGFQKRGHTEVYWMTRCRRWHARVGNFGTMILTDRERDVIHIVKGKMPEVAAMVKTLTEV